MIEQARTSRLQQMVDLAGTLAGRFAAHTDANDRAGRFPIENYRELHEAGFLRLIVPPEYGGAGADLHETVLFQERLAQGDGATAMAANMTMHLIGRLHERCTWPEPIFAAICRDIVASGALINAAASEPELGSPSRGGMPATTATPTDGGYLINGHKQFVSMAPALRYFVTSVALPPTPAAPQGATANAIVRAGSQGLRLHDTWGDALALRTSGSYDVLYQNVFVPDEWLVERQPVGQAPPAAPPIGMAWFALTMAAVYLGIGQAASDAICRYAQQRVPSALGKPIATLPAIQRRIGEGQAALVAARGVLYHIARDWVAHPERRAGMAPQIALAKYLCTNAALTATDQALRVAGGFGLTRQLPLERFYRDVRAGLTHPPQDDAALEMIGRAALDAAQATL
jgi:alkylation response protein AidB-like acyl-CoA dehydrogenase